MNTPAPSPTRRRKLVLFAVLLLLVLAVAACGRNQSDQSREAAATVQKEDQGAPATTTPQPAAVQSDTGAVDNSSPRAGDREPAARNDMYDTPPEMTIDPEKYYYATLKTEKGDIVVQLFAQRTPLTVNNFVFLAREGFYDNTTFHRVLEDFMAQAGDPTGTGTGGPGYRFQDEFFPGLEFDRPGLLAMANAGPGTNGSQFFITFVPTPWLNGRHTIFGEVIEGQDVLKRITLRDPQQSPDFEGDKILTIAIEERNDSVLPAPTPAPPTPTPTPTPTPYAPSSLAPDDLSRGDRPLAALPLAERSNAFNTPPDMVIDTAKTYTATIVTSRGEMSVALYDDEASVAVNNFVLLAALGFYDGTPVNDVSAGQALIIGAPENHPASYVGYAFSGEVSGERTWQEGAVGYLPFSDPQTGELKSNGSQLLIALTAPPSAAALQISFFGEVVDGIDVLNSLTTTDTIESIQIAVSQE